MAAEKAPAFQFYPRDFLMDGNVAGMSLEERGAYITLLCLCWLETSLPNDMARLARMVGVSTVTFRRLWLALATCFQITDGRLTHKRLELERGKQDAYRRMQSEKGKASAAGRQPDGNRCSTGLSTEPQPTGNSALSDLPSAICKEQEQKQRVPRRSQPAEHPDDNIGVITKMAHEVMDLLSLESTYDDLVEAVKSLCATRRIDYNSAAVLKALDSARVQRGVS